MANYLRKLLRDETGLIITAELIMIITIAVIALAAGWGAVATMMAEELEDIGNMMGSLDQSYAVSGLIAGPNRGFNRPMGFFDTRNTVNVSTSSNFNGQVGNLNFNGLIPVGETPVIPNLARFETNTLVEERNMLVEEETGLNVAIEETLLVELVELGIVTIREDGAVVLLREDLIEIQDDGEIRIRRDLIETESRSLREESKKSPETTENSTKDAARTEGKSLRSRSESASKMKLLQTENARLRELIERLCRETGLKP